MPAMPDDDDVEDVPLFDLGDPADPDPGNADPDAWTADLDPDLVDHVYDLVNEVAVDLPEPAGGN